MVQRPEDGGALEVRPSIPFVGELDGLAIARAMPAEHRLRGLFFTRCAGDLAADELAALAPLLREPIAKHIAFDDYPLHDYTVIFDRAARKVHPRVDAREAWRLYAREEIFAFAATMLGRVTLSLISDPTAAFLKLPSVFGGLAVGPGVTAEKVSDRAVRVELTSIAAPVEYCIGVFEGVVMSFKRHPRLEVEATGTTVRIVVNWTM
jgi:uncharacterized protein (TIGR02265 family)